MKCQSRCFTYGKACCTFILDKPSLPSISIVFSLPALWFSKPLSGRAFYQKINQRQYFLQAAQPLKHVKILPNPTQLQAIHACALLRVPAESMSLHSAGPGQMPSAFPA